MLHSGMAQSGRAKCELTLDLCSLLLKTHVKTLDDTAYKSEDLDIVVKKYVGFLSAIAKHTDRVGKDLVAGAARDVFGSSKAVAEAFGVAMKGALSHCMSKGSKATTGKKLSAAVMSVLVGSKSHKGSLMSLALAAPVKSEESSVLDESRPLADQPSSSTGVDSERDIYAIYGASPPKRAKAVASANSGPVQVLSSQEISDSEEPDAHETSTVFLL